MVAAKWRDKYGEEPRFREPVTLAAVFHYADKRMGDTDHLLTALMNALNGLAWTDDSWVWDMHVRKVPNSGAEGVEIRVARLGTDNLAQRS